ncbi:hypothetical protein HPP92_002786, partial [Vanilla planifolia]
MRKNTQLAGRNGQKVLEEARRPQKLDEQRRIDAQAESMRDRTPSLPAPARSKALPRRIAPKKEMT